MQPSSLIGDARRMMEVGLYAKRWPMNTLVVDTDPKRKTASELELNRNLDNFYIIELARCLLFYDNMFYLSHSIVRAKAPSSLFVVPQFHIT
ncbi:hypothetical protein RIF29_41149 [Crotalaria pallida]|uniref:Uncharacterized protein n=1 Tax=Crotalaria pallida TaxID=3830 RepID=A0AAN9HSD3_CROPI